MKVLTLSNMAPSEASPTHGLFVANQVAAIDAQGQIEQLDFVAIRSTKKGPVALLRKYCGMLAQVLGKAVFGRHRYDVIHVHYFYPTIWFALIYKWLRNRSVKIVVTFHGSDIYCYSNPGKAYRFAAKRIDHAVFVSQGLRQRYSLPCKQSTVISAGILDVYQPSDTDKVYDLVMVGAVNHNKGTDRLMAVLADCKRPLKVAVIGDGDWLDKLKQRDWADHQVSCLGRLAPEKVCAVLNQSRYLINLSRNESFGLVMTEAMACGLPVVATLTDGAGEQVRHGEKRLFAGQSRTTEHRQSQRAIG